MITRRFEYTGGGSDKFWEVTYPDANVDRGVRTWTTRWGRRGTDGQSKTFTEPAQHHAYISATGKIQEKLRKGYTEIAIPGGWRPTVRTREATFQRDASRAQPLPRIDITGSARESADIAEVAVRLAQASGITVEQAMDLIERVNRTQINPANFPALLAASQKKPIAPRPKRKITLEEE